MWRIHTSFVVLGVIITSILLGMTLRSSSSVTSQKMKAIVTTAKGKIEMKEVRTLSIFPIFPCPFPISFHLNFFFRSLSPPLNLVKF